jgi:hypothetical protein
MILGVAPRFDEATEYSYKWFSELKAEVEMQTLEASDATRRNVEELLRTGKFDAVIFYDHGDENGLVQQGGQGYCLDRSNLDILSGSTRVLYTMACLAGKGYGITAWQRGMVFTGYDDVFGFVVEEEHLFSVAAGSGFRAWSRGEKDWKKIRETMINTFNLMIENAKTAWARIWLTHDRDHLVVYDGEAPKSSTCPLRRIALRLFGPKGWKLRSIVLFKNLYWYDLWHMFLGFLTGFLWRTIWGPAIFIVYLVYQLIEEEPSIQSIRDILLYLATVVLGARMF